MNKIYYWGTIYKKQIQIIAFVFAIFIIIFSKKAFMIGVGEGLASGILVINIRDCFLYIRKKYKKRSIEVENN